MRSFKPMLTGMTVAAVCAAWVHFFKDHLPVLAHPDTMASIGHTQRLQGGLVAETISIEPSVFRIRDFVSHHEVDELVNLALSANINRDIAWSRTSDGRQSSIRSSRSAWLGKNFGAARGAPDSPTVQAVLERAAALIGINASGAEGVQVVRYPTRSQFRHHQDAHELEDSRGSFGGRNRLATVLVYFNDAETAVAGSERLLAGGETHFPLSKGQTLPHAHGLPPRPPDHSEEAAECHTHGLAIAPRAGDAILFFNIRRDGAVDAAATHAGCMVVDGFKWAANIWLWDGPPPPQKLLYSLERSDGQVVHVHASGIEEARALAEQVDRKGWT